MSHLPGHPKPSKFIPKPWFYLSKSYIYIPGTLQGGPARCQAALCQELAGFGCPSSTVLPMIISILTIIISKWIDMQSHQDPDINDFQCINILRQTPLSGFGWLCCSFRKICRTMVTPTHVMGAGRGEIFMHRRRASATEP